MFLPTKNNKYYRYAILSILITGLISYLPTAHRWGFYRDDWHVLWGQNAIGFGNILLQHQIDRPLMGLVYMVTSRVLGNPPIAWALLSITLRLAGGIIVFLIFDKLYPKARWMNPLMAALFTAYPGFLQVPNGNSYHVHLIAFTAGLFSLYLTLLLIKNENLVQRILLFILSALSGLLSYGMFEWMVGLELVRWILIIFHEHPRPKINICPHQEHPALQLAQPDRAFADSSSGASSSLKAPARPQMWANWCAVTLPPPAKAP